MRDTIKRAIRAHIDTLIGEDADLKRLIATATFDLHFGPSGCYEPDGDGWIYPGFETACDAIRDSILADVGTLYWLTDLEELADEEPEGWTDDDGTWNDAEEHYVIEPGEARRAYLGALADYL